MKDISRNNTTLACRRISLWPVVESDPENNIQKYKVWRKRLINFTTKSVKKCKLLSSKWLHIFKKNGKTSHRNIPKWMSASISGVPNLWYTIYVVLKNAKQYTILSIANVYKLWFRTLVAVGVGRKYISEVAWDVQKYL